MRDSRGERFKMRMGLTSMTTPAGAYVVLFRGMGERGEGSKISSGLRRFDAACRFLWAH